MRPHNRVLVNHRLAPLDAPARRRRRHLLDARVRRPQAVQPLLEQRAQPVVGLGGVDEERVAARLGLVEDVQERRARRLLLVRHVRVPRHRARAVGEVGVDAVVACAAVDEVDLGVAFGGAGGGVDVVAVGG